MYMIHIPDLTEENELFWRKMSSLELKTASRLLEGRQTGIKR